jgi:hypothetical protein
MRSGISYIAKTPLKPTRKNKEKMVQHIMVGYVVKTPSNLIGKLGENDTSYNDYCLC